MLLFPILASAASFYTTRSQSFSSSGSATTTHTFTLPANQKVASSGYVKIELTGDFDASNEYADIYIEGSYVGKATGGSATCTTNLTKNFPLSQSDLEKWGADGKIVVTVQNSSAVSGCTDSQRKHGLALSITNLVSSQPAQTLSKVRLTCPSTITEGATGSCSANADFSDGSSSVVTSSVTNWKIDKAGSISSAGVITAGQVSSDQFATITGDYTYNGKTMTGIGTTLIKDDSISGLRAFRIVCPSTLNENSNAQCQAYATIDGTERNVSTSSTWSENATYTTINTSGVLASTEVDSDSGSYVKASYSYGGVTKFADQVVTIKDVPVTVNSLSITCPSSINESSTANCKAIANISNGTTVDVSRSSLWSSNSSFASIDANGLVTTNAVSSDQVITISTTFYSKNGLKTATSSLTVKDVPATTGKTVQIKNRYRGSLVSFNGNSDWVISTVSGVNTFCEKSRPTYCLNVANGSLQSTVISNTSPYAQWAIEDYDGNKKIRNIGFSTYYINHEGASIVAGIIQPGWWSAQWILEESSTNTVSSLSFTSKSNSSIKLTVGGNSEWILTKDTVYLTDAYKICEKNRPTYCLHIEYNDTLQNSQIQSIWYSALWEIRKFSDNSLIIRSKWKPNKYIVINASGATLVNEKNLTTSSIEKVKSLIVSIPSWFISTANAGELYIFGEMLKKFMAEFKESEIMPSLFKDTDKFNAIENSKSNENNTEKLDFPFSINETWYVCQGNHALNPNNTWIPTHSDGKLSLAVDLVSDKNSAIGTFGCNTNPPYDSISSNKKVLAPTNGKATTLPQGDMVCFKFENGKGSMMLGHIYASDIKDFVNKSFNRGDVIGSLDKDAKYAGGISHIHMGLYSDDNCKTQMEFGMFDMFNGSVSIKNEAQYNNKYYGTSLVR